MTGPHELPEPPRRSRGTSVAVWIVAAAAVAAVVFLVIGKLTETDRADNNAAAADSATNNAKSLADQVKAACARGDVSVASLCRKGSEVAANPAPSPQPVAGPQGAPGVNGAPGVPGAPGASGQPGIPGTPGVNGANGSNGQDGSPGATGAPGVPGKDGAPGKDGKDGAPGADGEDGVSVTGVTFDWTSASSCAVTVSFSDGTSKTYPTSTAACDPSKQPSAIRGGR